MVIKRIGVGSLAKVAACIYASIGLIVGLCLFLLSLVGAGLTSGAEADPSVPAWLGPVFGAGAIIILPILYGALGAIALSLVALLYNAAARSVGGLELEVDH